ncbi:unnamed protein product [Amoebophrya sp. A25]|nr:unnamed protein product [Amoebophrya sp. A25]|eukprot:GSA25T00004678001.1
MGLCLFREEENDARILKLAELKKKFQGVLGNKKNLEQECYYLWGQITQGSFPTPGQAKQPAQFVDKADIMSITQKFIDNIDGGDEETLMGIDLLINGLPEVIYHDVFLVYVRDVMFVLDKELHRRYEHALEAQGSLCAPAYQEDVGGGVQHYCYHARNDKREPFHRSQFVPTSSASLAANLTFGAPPGYTPRAAGIGAPPQAGQAAAPYGNGQQGPPYGGGKGAPPGRPPPYEYNNYYNNGGLGSSQPQPQGGQQQNSLLLQQNTGQQFNNGLSSNGIYGNGSGMPTNTTGGFVHSSSGATGMMNASSSTILGRGTSSAGRSPFVSGSFQTGGARSSTNLSTGTGAFGMQMASQQGTRTRTTGSSIPSPFVPPPAPKTDQESVVGGPARTSDHLTGTFDSLPDSVRAPPFIPQQHLKPETSLQLHKNNGVDIDYPPEVTPGAKKDAIGASSSSGTGGALFENVEQVRDAFLEEGVLMQVFNQFYELEWKYIKFLRSSPTSAPSSIELVAPAQSGIASMNFLLTELDRVIKGAQVLAELGEEISATKAAQIPDAEKRLAAFMFGVDGLLILVLPDARVGELCFKAFKTFGVQVG